LPFGSLKLPDVKGIDETVPDNPADGTPAEIDSWFCKKHAPALSRLLSYIEGNIADLYQAEEAFAAFLSIMPYQLLSRNQLGG
jgi:hypothetical protein